LLKLEEPTEGKELHNDMAHHSVGHIFLSTHARKN